jgi:hypothetical protein
MDPVTGPYKIRSEKGAASTIDSKQISEIKMHLAELRKALNANDGR